jgi:hypothetical protein
VRRKHVILDYRRERLYTEGREAIYRRERGYIQKGERLYTEGREAIYRKERGSQGASRGDHVRGLSPLTRGKEKDKK